MLGAFLVFMTFVAKDYLRDSAKDELTVITNAKAEYAARVDHDELLQAVHDASDGKSWSDGGSGSDTSFSGDPTVAELLGNAAPAMGADFSQGLQQTDILGMKMRDEPEVAGARSAAYQFTEKLPRARAVFNSAFILPTPNALRARASQEQKDAEKQLERATDEASKAADNYHKTTLFKANARQTAKQYEYERFTLWSWFLFAFGWAVTLLGKMLEPECAPKDAPEVEA